ncbi:hypothetical protein L226DRAFT_152414 [Lentinus tigrinus ALCF2SS1-7]|uniref:uncharacterized protein n=1 Tax=Lentinus tigrinus ALCF2SS1-7 TaxID=1328758 RepID=UPI001165D198|nr:hypothetical protein L226DRAFT_152414 [Lentinus tigrinus ALCF2SS1-7]
MTRYYKPTFPAHDDAWDHHDEISEPPSLSKPTDKLLSDSEHPSSFMDPDLESASSEKSSSAERRRCCTRLSVPDWTDIFTILLAYAVIFGLTLAISLAHFFVGARILKYPTEALQYSYEYTRHYLGGTTVTRHGLGVTGTFMRSIATGSAIMALVLCVLAGLALAIFTIARWKREVSGWAVYWVVTMGSTAVAAAVAGVGVWLHPVEELSVVHAFSAGGAGFAVMVVPFALFFGIMGLLAGGGGDSSLCISDCLLCCAVYD